ncbi:MAG: type III secretion system inner membrane ring lipoprotein SctJ [Bosea sp. (in: a-proteobacteria)]
MRVACALGLAMTLAACQEDLYTGLNQRSANDMMAVLAENGVKASRGPGGAANTYAIRVASDDMSRAVRVLRAAGYPKDSYRSIAEIFPGDGIIVTPYEQRARMSYAISQELSRTITDIDGVVTARVHVMLPEGDTRNTGRNLPPSASVVVQHRDNIDPGDLAQRVRLIVSNAVTNLPARSVAVSLFPAKAPAEPSAVMSGISQPGGGLFEVKSPFGFTLWILAALALLAGVLVFNSVRKQPR